MPGSHTSNNYVVISQAQASRHGLKWGYRYSVWWSWYNIWCLWQLFPLSVLISWSFVIYNGFTWKLKVLKTNPVKFGTHTKIFNSFQEPCSLWSDEWGLVFTHRQPWWRHLIDLMTSSLVVWVAGLLVGRKCGPICMPPRLCSLWNYFCYGSKWPPWASE